MRTLVLSVAMVAAGGAVLAGSGLAQQEPVTVASGFTIVMPGSGCPVGFSAEVSARAVARSVEEEKRYGTAPAVELRFAPRDERRVVKASVILHGLPVGSRVLEVGNHEAGAASEKFELAAEKGLWEREVRVTRLRVVRWAEITEMTYGDGTRWRPGEGESCRARPSLFREVGAVAGR